MKYKYKITGVDCPVCASRLATMLAKTEGVDYVKINFLTERLTVDSNLGEDAFFGELVKTAHAFDKSVNIEK